MTTTTFTALHPRWPPSGLIGGIDDGKVAAEKIRSHVAD
jgi:hypothetical protein